MTRLEKSREDTQLRTQGGQGRGGWSRGSRGVGQTPAVGSALGPSCPGLRGPRRDMAGGRTGQVASRGCRTTVPTLASSHPPAHPQGVPPPPPSQPCPCVQVTDTQLGCSWPAAPPGTPAGLAVLMPREDFNPGEFPTEPPREQGKPGRLLMGSTPAAGPGWEWGGVAEAGSVARLMPEPSPPGQSCKGLLGQPDWRDSWAPDTQSCDSPTGRQVPGGDPAPKWASGPGRPEPACRSTDQTQAPWGPAPRTTSWS